MPAENPTRHDDPRSDSDIERDILYCLTDTDDGQPLWSADDIGRNLGLRHPGDYTYGLRRAGLIHETTDGFIFATRAGVRSVQMIGRVI